MTLTAERVRQLLEYDGETGVLTWKKIRKNFAGKAVNTHTDDGYIKICVDGKTYSGHRVVWLHVYGDWPKYQVDHINGVRDDNRIENLRDVPNWVNQQNMRKAHRDSSSGVLGACLERGKWKAAIKFNGVVRRIGQYPTAEEAHAAYVEAKRRLHEGCTI